MKNVVLITALSLCSFSWISASESSLMEVQAGADVLMRCSNFSSSPTQIIWFRVVRRAQLTVIGSMFDPSKPARFKTGFDNGQFEMSSDISTVFLKIKQLNASDSGLYFCGYLIRNNPVMHDVVFLDVQDQSVVKSEFGEMLKLLSWILAALTVFLSLVIVCLVVKIKKLHRARVEEQNTLQNQSEDELNYAAVTFRPRIKPNRREDPDSASG